MSEPNNPSHPSLPDVSLQAVYVEVQAVKVALGTKEQPGTFPGDPPIPGTGVLGTLERLARAEDARSKAHRSAAAKTGAITAGVLAVVLKVAEMIFVQREGVALPLPPPSTVQP